MQPSRKLKYERKRALLYKNQLGMWHTTAQAKLVRKIMVHLAHELGKDVCFRCKLPILNAEDLTIEHKKP